MDPDSHRGLEAPDGAVERVEVNAKVGGAGTDAGFAGGHPEPPDAAIGLTAGERRSQRLRQNRGRLGVEAELVVGLGQQATAKGCQLLGQQLLEGAARSVDRHRPPGLPARGLLSAKTLQVCSVGRSQ